MKKLVNIQKVEGEGLVGLLGEKVMLFCMNYIYAGKLVGVNDKDVRLDDASLVYETGPLVAKGFTDAQAMPGPLYVMTSAIESYCKSGR
jgi:hypothetical protein